MVGIVKNDYYITEGEVCGKVYNLDIVGIRVSFSLDHIGEKEQEWYCKHLTESLQYVADCAAHAERTKMQNDLQKLLGL